MTHTPSIQNIGARASDDFRVPEAYVAKSRAGLSQDVIHFISEHKREPAWMLANRLEAYRIFMETPMPRWGNAERLATINFDEIFYYLKPTEKASQRWEDVPADIKTTFDRLGLPEAEQKHLAGVTAQYESEVVYHALGKELTAQGVIFTDMDSALREHEDVVRAYFGSIVPAADNKFAALNTAVWSGGSFVYVPKNTTVTIPIQAYFRMNAEHMGQFERTLIIVDEGASVHYIEGCTAPSYTSNALHAAVVEIIAHPKSSLRYTTIQNWSNNVFNLVTKRAIAEADARVEWVDGNIGSGLTMKYPAIILKGARAHGEVLSIAFAGAGQHQDTGTKAIHLAPRTTSRVVSKSISTAGGRASYRGLIKVPKSATDARSHVRCDALMMGADARSDTYPTMDVRSQSAKVEHEATVSKVEANQLFYLQSRGLTIDQATTMIVSGFIAPFTKELPMEYAVELNRLIQLEMEGAAH